MCRVSVKWKKKICSREMIEQMTYVFENGTYELHTIILSSIYAVGTKWKYFFHEYYVAWACPYSEAVAQRCSVEKIFLKISKNLQENTRARVSFLIKLHAYKVAGLRLCEFCEISKNTIFYRTPLVAASTYWNGHVFWSLKKWRAIRASVGGVGGVLMWVTWLAY